MSFSFSLKKGRVQKPQLKKAAFASPLQEVQAVVIDGFGKNGATSGGASISAKPEVVIRPQTLRVGLRKQKKSTIDANARNSDVSDVARLSLLAGESVSLGRVLATEDSLDAQEVSEKDYEEIPVEEFGAALLRGMGWDGKLAKSEVDNSLALRRRGLTLGIGAKSAGHELDEELMARKNLSVPLRKRDQMTENGQDPA